jgi:hypothetical protein
LTYQGRAGHMWPAPGRHMCRPAGSYMYDPEQQINEQLDAPIYAHSVLAAAGAADLGQSRRQFRLGVVGPVEALADCRVGRELLV